MSLTPTPEWDDEDDAPPAIDTTVHDVRDLEADDYDDDEDNEGDDGDLDGDFGDAPPPLPPNVRDIHSGTDPDDPDLTGEPFGVALTDTDRAALVEGRGIAPEYLDLPHVQTLLRSITDLAQVPSKRRWAFDKDAAGTGIAYGWRDPSDTAVAWQLRPTYPRAVDGRAAKYVFRKGIQTPVGLVSAPRTFPASHHKLVLVEGTNQALATAAALRDDPQYVVIGFAGCENAMRNGNLQPGIAVALRNAEEVYLIPDADAATNWRVYNAMDKVAKAIRARSGGKRGIVKFVRLIDADAKQGMDDLLAAVPADDRRQTVLDMLDGAMTTSCDVPPRKPRGTSDNSAFIINGNVQNRAAAEHILATHNLRIDAARNDLWRYDKGRGIYAPDRAVTAGNFSAVIGNALRDMLGNDFHVRHIASVEFSVREALRDRGATIPSAYGDTQGRIPFANGNYNTKTRTLEPFSPDIAITYRLLSDYNPDAPFVAVPAWLRANTALDDGVDQLDVLLDVISAVFDSILGVRIQKIAILYGESRSGKGTFCNDLLSRILPEDQVAAVGLHELTPEKRFSVSTLDGCIASITGELPDAFIKDTSILKAATGGDVLFADVKNKKPLKFRNRAAFIMSGNHPPKMSDSANANRNRMQGVLFPRSHAGTEDLDLVDRLISEVDGLTYALVQAWHARQERKGQFLPEHPQAHARLSAALNPMSGFVQDCLLLPTDDDWTGTSVSPKFHLTRTALFKTYEAYMRFVGRGGGTLHIDNVLEPLTRLGVKADVRNAETRSRGFSVGLNHDSDLVQAILDRDQNLRDLIANSGSTAAPKKFQRASAAETPPPPVVPVEVLPKDTK